MRSTSTSRHIILGIDPGLKGAIAAIDWRTHELLSVHDMPCLRVRGRDGHTRDVLDLPNLDRIVRGFAESAKFAVVEDPDKAQPRDGRTSAMRYGKNVGVALMSVVAAGVPLATVLPETWKPALRVPADKKLAVAAAEKLFDEPVVFRGPRGGGLDGRAEAALLAWFGVKHLVPGAQV